MPNEVHDYEVHDYEVHAHEMHAREIHVYNTHAHKIGAHKKHICEILLMTVTPWFDYPGQSRTFRLTEVQRGQS